MYTEMSRFDPIGAGFMLSIDDDGFFTVSSDPRVRLFYVFCSVSQCVGYGVRFIMGCARWAWVVVCGGIMTLNDLILFYTLTLMQEGTEAAARKVEKGDKILEIEGVAIKVFPVVCLCV